MWKGKDWFGAEERPSVGFLFFFRLGKDTFNFCVYWSRKNPHKSTYAQSLNVRLSLYWAGSECQGAHQWKEKEEIVFAESLFRSWSPGFRILPCFHLLFLCGFYRAIGSEMLQHLRNNRKGNYVPCGHKPGGTKSSPQAGLWCGHQWRSEEEEPEKWCGGSRVEGLS